MREELLQVVGGLRVGELRFVDFEIVALLECREKFDAVERGKIFQRGRQERKGSREGRRFGIGSGRDRKLSYYTFSNNGEPRFARGCAGEVGIGPEEPAANALVIGERGIGRVDRFLGNAVW